MTLKGDCEEKSRKYTNFNSAQNPYKVCYWMVKSGESGMEEGDLKEVRFVVILLGRFIYHVLALLWILIFDFYMILYSR